MEDQAEKLREIMKRKKENSAASSPSKSNVKAVDKARIITVTSGKGGVGKTNLSVNMALAFARMGKKVIVMDADLGLANVNVMLNMIPKYNLYHVIKKTENNPGNTCGNGIRHFHCGRSFRLFSNCQYERGKQKRLYRRA